MKKFLKYSLIVAFSVFVLDYAMGYFLDKKFSLSTGGKATVAYGNHYGIALMGASEMCNQYVTSIICDSLGLTAYNYGSGGQNIYYQYALLNLMINHAQKQK